MPERTVTLPAIKFRMAKCGHPVRSAPGRQRNECDDCCLAAGRTPPPGRQLKIRNHTCAGCGEDFTRMASGPAPKRPACSKPCRTWIASGKQGLRPQIRRCARCQEEIPAARPNARYCTAICSDIAAGRRRAEPLPIRTCALAECDIQFQPLFDRQRCCCEKHGKVHSHREYRAAGKEVREEWGDARRERHHKRRALKKEAGTGNPVRFSEIAERDQWTCGLCRDAVDSALEWPDPMSASLDHIVPLTKGGVHDPANVQLAHLKCNTAKGNRGGPQQFTLIG